MKQALRLSWYPFRSVDVEVICNNLTSDEASRLSRYSSKVGALFGFLIPLVFLPILYFGIWYAREPNGNLGLLGFMIALGFIILLIASAPIRKTTKIMLCDTAYAQIAGYTPRTLRLYSLGQRKEAEQNVHGNTH